MEDEKIQRSYYAIIPATVRYDRNITPNAKLLYAEITALTNEKGYCWASNEYFARLYNVSKVSISKWIKQLVEAGYVRSEMGYEEGSPNILERHLIVSDSLENRGGIKEKLKGALTKVKGGVKEKLKDNNKYNNKDNTKDIKIYDISAERHSVPSLGDERKTDTSTTTATTTATNTATNQSGRVTLSLSEVEGHPGKYLRNTMTAPVVQKLYDIQAGTGDKPLHSLTLELINKGYIEENDGYIQKYNDLFFELIDQYGYPIVRRCFDYSLRWALKGKESITSKYAYLRDSLVSNVKKINKQEQKSEPEDKGLSQEFLTWLKSESEEEEKGSN